MRSADDPFDRGPGGPHVPMMPAEDVARITAWHERAYREDRRTAAVEVDYLGLRLTIAPDVQPIVPVSDLLGTAVRAEVTPADRVLDMGTGSGVNALLAAPVAREVVAVDVNPRAVACARRNARANGLEDRVTVLHGDLFAPVEGRFDLIVFDPPFRWFRPRDLREGNLTDEHYATLTAFFRQLDAHLAPRGRLLLFFGTSGDMAYLHHLIARAGMVAAPVASRDHQRDGWTVTYTTFRVTRSRAG